MALLATTTQVLHDGGRNVIMQFTGIGNGTGDEIAVTKVDVTALKPPCAAVKVRKLTYDIVDGSVKLQWEAAVNKDFHLASNNRMFDYKFNGGLVNNGGNGQTGNILFSTLDSGPSFTYTITLEMIKKY